MAVSEKQTLEIIKVLYYGAKIIILDEPTVGLDPIQIVEIRQLIQELGQEHTVILSSHILQEISAVCDWVIMISKGRIDASDSMENLLANASAAGSIQLETEADEPMVQKALENIAGVKNLAFSKKGNRLLVTVTVEEGTQPGDDIFMALRRENLPVLSMTDGAGQGALEDLFIQLAGESLDAGAAYAADKAAKKEKKEKQAPVGESPLGSAYYDNSADEPATNDEKDADAYKSLFEEKEEEDQ